MAYQKSNHRRATQKGGGVSLFPFLAVLICTMGSLIVLLMLIAQQAQLQGTEEDTVPEVAEVALPVEDVKFADVPEEEIQTRREMLEMETWRLEQLQHTRDEHRRLLQESRNALSHAQSEVQKLEEEARILAQAAKETQATHETADTRELKMKIAERELEIEKLEEAIRVAESSARERDGTYAVVPYVGPGGTRRYPFYIECRGDGAYLMPENIHLTRRDFEGVLSRGNPLEATLMAKRAYLAQTGVFAETEEGIQEPYPLLIVRPEGITFMYMARAALKSWDTEYGYELVDNGKKIVYPPVDEAMKHQMLAAMNMARNYQVQLAHAAPTISGLAGGTNSDAPALAFRPSGGSGGMPVNVDENSRLARTLRNSGRRPEGVVLGGGGSRDAVLGGGMPAGGGQDVVLGGGMPARGGGTSQNAQEIQDAYGAEVLKQAYPESYAFHSPGQGGTADTPAPWMGGGVQAPRAPAATGGGGSGLSVLGEKNAAHLHEQKMAGIENPEPLDYDEELAKMARERELLQGAERYELSENFQVGLERDLRQADIQAERRRQEEIRRRNEPGFFDEFLGSVVDATLDAAVDAANGRKRYDDRPSKDRRHDDRHRDGRHKPDDDDENSEDRKKHRHEHDGEPCEKDHGNKKDREHGGDHDHKHDHDREKEKERERQLERQRQRDRERERQQRQMYANDRYTSPPPGMSDVSISGDSGSVGVQATFSPQDMSQTKGMNWALDNYRASQVPLSRPIRVECYPDAYVIPSTGDMPQITIPHTTPYKNMTQLAKEVGKYVESWGAPGPGMYWRPKLRVTVVAEGGEPRLQEMNLLLQNSGLEIERMEN